MRKYEAFLTNNGNIAVVVKESRPEDGQTDVQYCAFITPKGEWLREATFEEVTNVAFSNKLPLADLQMVRDFFDKVLPQQAPTWEFMGSIRYQEDYTSYKAETCNNGGDYAFYTNLDVYFTTINGKAVIRGVTRYSTSAEFEYDELNGSFQTNLTVCQVLNAYADNGGDTVRFSWYSTQGDDNCFLEQISSVYKLEDIYNLKSRVIELNETGDIIEGEYDSPEKDDIIAKLVTAGASFAPAGKSNRRR